MVEFYLLAVQNPILALVSIKAQYSLTNSRLPCSLATADTMQDSLHTHASTMVTVSMVIPFHTDIGQS